MCTFNYTSKVFKKVVPFLVELISKLYTPSLQVLLSGATWSPPAVPNSTTICPLRGWCLLFHPSKFTFLFLMYFIFLGSANLERKCILLVLIIFFLPTHYSTLLFSSVLLYMGKQDFAHNRCSDIIIKEAVKFIMKLKAQSHKAHPRAR